MDAVRLLDRNLFEAYVERRADPVAGSLEPGIYAGYFDWRDCQTPTGIVKAPPHPLVCHLYTGVSVRDNEEMGEHRYNRRKQRSWHGGLIGVVVVVVSCVKYNSLMAYCKYYCDLSVPPPPRVSQPLCGAVGVQQCLDWPFTICTPNPDETVMFICGLPKDRM